MLLTFGLGVWRSVNDFGFLFFLIICAVLHGDCDVYVGLFCILLMFYAYSSSGRAY